MKDNKVRDPKGEELVPVLLQVLAKKGDRPTLCSVRHDNETVQLAADAQRLVTLSDGESVPDTVTFLVLWAPANGPSPLPSSRLIDQMNAIEQELRGAREIVERTRIEVNTTMLENEQLSLELEQKTAALRELQRERDPQRLERMVEARTEALAKELDDIRQSSISATAQLVSQIAELKQSKKKLRESIERMKEDAKQEGRRR